MTKKGGSRRISEKRLQNILFVLSTPPQYAVKTGILQRAPLMGIAKLDRPEVEFIDFEEFAALLAAGQQKAEADPAQGVLSALSARHGLAYAHLREDLQPICFQQSRAGQK